MLTEPRQWLPLHMEEIPRTMSWNIRQEKVGTGYGTGEDLSFSPCCCSSAGKSISSSLRSRTGRHRSEQLLSSQSHPPPEEDCLESKGEESVKPRRRVNYLTFYFNVLHKNNTEHYYNFHYFWVTEGNMRAHKGTVEKGSVSKSPGLLEKGQWV